MNHVASIKDRLKNRSQETGKTMQELLTAYGLERTIYRLSISRYKENFVLKGGIFLYALFNGSFARATTDIDLLAQKNSNETEDIKEVFAEVFSIETDDPLRFDLDTLVVKPITEFKKYHGANVYIMSYLDRTRIPVSIDVGFGDVIYPCRVEMNFPVIMSDENPKIYAYSLYSVIAEKFEAIVSLAYDNSRFKDFYDIYVLSTTHNFDGEELAEALKETFETRHTSFEEIVIFEDDFAEDPVRQTRWKAFVKKKRAILPITLQETIESIQSFLGPVVETIMAEEILAGKWNSSNMEWEKTDE